MRAAALLALGLVVVLLGLFLTRLAFGCVLAAGISVREFARGLR